MAERTPEQGPDWNTLVGKFFHTFEDEGYIQRQGMVLGDLTDGYFMVQYFEWLSGSVSFYGTQIVHIREMANAWAFYATDAAMREAYEYGGKARRA